MIEFSKITPELFVGTCPRTAIDLNQIRLAGVTGIVSVQTDQDFVTWDIDFEGLKQASYDLELPIARHPIIDFDDADLKKNLLAVVDTVHRMIAVGHRLYLHCTAGQERAPTVAAAYLCRHKGMSARQAVDVLKSERDCLPKLHIIDEVLNA